MTKSQIFFTAIVITVVVLVVGIIFHYADLLSRVGETPASTYPSLPFFM